MTGWRLVVRIAVTLFVVLVGVPVLVIGAAHAGQLVTCGGVGSAPGPHHCTTCADLGQREARGGCRPTAGAGRRSGRRRRPGATADRPRPPGRPRSPAPGRRSPQWTD